MEAKDLVLALRTHPSVKLSQDQLEAAGGGRPARDVVSKVENGKNKLTSFGLRAEFANAFGIDVKVFADYLDGKLNLEEVVAHRTTRPSTEPAPSRRLSDRDDWEAAVAGAKQIAPYVPEEIFLRIGTCIDHALVPYPTDPRGIADIGDALLRISLRQTAEPSAPSSHAPRTKRSRPR